MHFKNFAVRAGGSPVQVVGALAALTACSGNAAFAPLSQHFRQFSAHGAIVSESASGANLYVANGGGRAKNSPPPGQVTVYGLKRGKLLQTITAGIDRPSAVGFDAIRNRIVVANREPAIPHHAGSVAVFIPGTSKPLRRLRGSDNPGALAFDSAGWIYVANEGTDAGDGGGVKVYRPGGTSPVRTIRGGSYGMWQPKALAFDQNGNLYVAGGPGPVGSQDDVYMVAVYAPGRSSPKAIIETRYPRALAVSGGYLYVANAPPKRSRHNPNGSVSVYKLPRYDYAALITEGIHTPDALAFDAAGNLYVANLNGHDVTEYAPGGALPIHTISRGVTSPRSLVIGAQGNLYVCNVYQSTISVYGPQQRTPFLTIEQGLNAPISLALSSP